jgi:hypothetical protein
VTATDGDIRLFVNREPAQVQLFFERIGFRLLFAVENHDGLDLLRALCEIAQTEYRNVQWHPDIIGKNLPWQPYRRPLSWWL